MTTDRIPTIRSMLFWLVTACVLPASLMAIALVVYNYQRGQAQVLGDYLGTARAMTSVVDRDLASAESALFALSTSPYLSSNDLAGFYDQAKEALRDQNVTNIVLIDATGQQQINTLRPFGAPLPSKGIPDALQDIFTTDKPAITDLFQGPVTGAPIVAVGVPVRRNGKIIYILSAGILTDRLAAILERARLPPDWIGGVLDSSGVVVARTRDAERYVGHKGAANIVERMALAPEGSLESNTLEGIVYSKGNMRLKP